jgi:phosphoribosyl 1,2-cyclic phosphodiesterase
MKIDILASGSGGNCIAVRSGSTTILVDAGIAKTKIEKRLLEVGIESSKIDAVLITHAHGDHIKGLPLANKYLIPVYASKFEWKDLKDKVDDGLRFISEPDEHFPVRQKQDWIDVTPFQTHHDAYGPLGYSLIDGENKVSICLDTGKIDSDMLNAMEGSDIYIIEANHDPDLVAESSYPDSVKARILSDLGHLSNDQCAAALKQLVQGRGERIYLTHLSSSNNMPQLAELTVKRALTSKGLVCGRDYHLEVV